MKYVSIKNIIARLYRDFPIEREFPIGSLVEWIADCVERAGGFGTSITRIAKVEITDHRGKLPCDFDNLNQVAFDGEPMYKTMSSFFIEAGEQTGDLKFFGVDVDDEHFPMLADSHIRSTHEYEIRGECIYTDIEKGTIFISYEAVYTDKEGFIMVPDNEYLIAACVDYCYSQFAKAAWIKAVDFNESRKWENVYREFAIKSERQRFAARGDISMPDIGTMENLKNVLVRLIPRINSFKDYFNSISHQEIQWIV
jgi:hypothetical protein